MGAIEACSADTGEGARAAVTQKGAGAAEKNGRMCGHRGSVLRVMDEPSAVHKTSDGSAGSSP